MSAVGIDVGYQSCYIAVARQGGIETVANEYSDRNTPAYISLGEKQRSVGAAGKQQIVSNIKNTIWGFKKFLGRKFNDAVVQREKQFVPYQVVEGPNGSTCFKVNYLGEAQLFTPEQILGMMFTKVREVGEMNLKAKVMDCVINVPCYYTDVERRAIMDASQMAGLNCVRLMNDTTATALAYGIYKQDLPAPEEKPRIVIFVDMGHCDLQVAACAFHKGKLKMLANAADAELGGRDFDHLLVEHFIEDFGKRYKLDVRNNARACVRLATECEKLKKLMSANSTEIPINIECFMEDKDVSGRMKREQMETLAAGMLQRVEQTMQAVMDYAKLKQEDIYSVEIVGGSTRIPAIKDLVKKVFGKDASTTLNADEAVARGCALQCAIMSPIFRVRDFSITDCQPYPITLSWQGSTMDEDSTMEVFSKFHPIPFSKLLTFYRKEPFSMEARYSCPQDVPHPNTSIGSFQVDKITPQGDGEASKVKVKVRVNVHGLFTVSSATMVEKLEQQEEEETPATEEAPKNGEVPMETETTNEGEKGKTQNGPKDVEKMEEGSPQAAEEMQQGEASPDASKQNGDIAADSKDLAATEGGGDKKEPANKKSKKVKMVDLPVTLNVPSLTKDEINLMFEREMQMIANDKLEKERMDAKNALEEYVYEMRDKIYSDYEQYITEEDRTNFSATLSQVEDWLYDEGEDQNKAIYQTKISDLKKIGGPVKDRYTEAQLRPEAFQALGKELQLVRKAVDAYANKDEKYEHLDAKDMEKVTKCLQETTEWFEKNMNACTSLPSTQNAPITVAQIAQKKQSLDSTCLPVLNKPKPKPKEDPPKDDKKDQKAANDKDNTDKTAENSTEATTQENSKEGEKIADMDLD